MAGKIYDGRLMIDGEHYQNQYGIDAKTLRGKTRRCWMELTCGNVSTVYIKKVKLGDLVNPVREMVEHGGSRR